VGSDHFLYLLSDEKSVLPCRCAINSQELLISGTETKERRYIEPAEEGGRRVTALACKPQHCVVVGVLLNLVVHGSLYPGAVRYNTRGEVN
jgi:hypothetical protein